MTRFALKKDNLVAVWKVDWKRAGLEAGRPVRKLL